MTKLYVKVQNMLQDESGQDLIEYALLGALIAVLSITAMGNVSTAINAEFAKIVTALG
jgi:pilus assembly protein Flp/PilA